MCLSTAYRGSAEDSNLLLSNVQRIECRSGQVILTDIMERQLAVEGRIVEADLINNRVIIAAAD